MEIPRPAVDVAELLERAVEVVDEAEPLLRLPRKVGGVRVQLLGLRVQALLLGVFRGTISTALMTNLLQSFSAFSFSVMRQSSGWTESEGQSQCTWLR